MADDWSGESSGGTALGTSNIPVTKVECEMRAVRATSEENNMVSALADEQTGHFI